MAEASLPQKFATYLAKVCAACVPPRGRAASTLVRARRDPSIGRANFQSTARRFVGRELGYLDRSPIRVYLLTPKQADLDS